MEFMISGRNLTVSDRFREYADDKISKIASLGDKVQRVDAKVTKETKARQTAESLTVELTVLGRGPVIRAEASAADKFKFTLQPNTGHEVTPQAFREVIAWLEQWLKPNGRQ